MGSTIDTVATTGSGATTGAGGSERAAWAPWVLAAVLVLVATLLVASLPTVPYHAESDEGFYLRYMKTVAEEGPAALPGLFRWYVEDPAHFNYPPPSRIGFVAVTALWGKLFGSSLAALSHVSIASHLAFVVLTYAFARRFFGDPRALWIAVSSAFSPILLGLGRQALMDSFILLCSALVIWLFLAVVERPEERRRWYLFAAAFAFSILVKELTALFALPFLVFVAVERWSRKRPLNLSFFVALIAVPGLACLPVFVLAAGGVEPLVTTFRGILAGPATNPYTIQFGSGPWYRYLIDFLLLSQVATLLALGFFGALLLRLKRGEYVREHVYFALLAALLLFEHSFVTKNARYLIVLEMPLRIFAVAAIVELCASRSAARMALLSGALVAGIAWLDWRSYDELFVRKRLYDPVTPYILIHRDVFPRELVQELMRRR